MKFTRAIVLAGVSTLSIAAPAYAQGGSDTAQAPRDEASSAEIIVTARRRDEDIQAVPLVVNAVTAEQIQKLNLRDFNEVQNLVPGLQFFSNSNGIAAGAQLRGIQYDPNAGVSASVAFYQNDALIEGSLVLQSMYDIGQVEVLRGPQGTLRGTATPSGSIVVTTHRPDLYKFGGYVSGTVNNLGTENINGGINIPVIKGIAAIRVAGLYNTSEGNRIHTIQTDGDHRNPFSDTQSGRVSLLVEPADWVRLSGTYQTMKRSAREFDQYASFSLYNSAAAASPRLITPGDRLSIESNPRTVDQTFPTATTGVPSSALPGSCWCIKARSTTSMSSPTPIRTRQTSSPAPTSSRTPTRRTRPGRMKFDCRTKPGSRECSTTSSDTTAHCRSQ